MSTILYSPGYYSIQYLNSDAQYSTVLYTLYVPNADQRPSVHSGRAVPAGRVREGEQQRRLGGLERRVRPAHGLLALELPALARPVPRVRHSGRRRPQALMLLLYSSYGVH